MAHHLFDPKNAARLRDPERKTYQDPARLFPAVREYVSGDAAEIGCGTGFATFPMAAFLSGRGTLFALDLQPEMLSLFEEERRKREPELTVRTMECGPDRIPLPDSSVELVYLVNVFHELSDPRAMIREIHRVLTPAGQCLVVDWKKEETPKGPPAEERVALVALFDHLIEGGFLRLRSRDLYPYHYAVEAFKE